MDQSLEKLLKKIALFLNAKKVSWAVGGSTMLNYYNISQTINNLDIVTTIEDIDSIHSTLSSMGTTKQRTPNSNFKTKYFFEYTIDGINVNLMSGLCVMLGDTEHHFPFNKESVGDIMYLDTVPIPLAKLGDWYNIYKLLPNRDHKVEAIKKYLLNKK
nr:hypothetical protein [uncultured Cetobacterium sp.]